MPLVETLTSDTTIARDLVMLDIAAELDGDAVWFDELDDSWLDNEPADFGGGIL